MKNCNRVVFRILITCLFFFSGSIYSNVVRIPPDSSGKVGDRFLIDANNFTLPINNYGFLASVNIDERTGGKLNGDMVLFDGGFYLAGKINDDIWMSNVSSSSLLKDYIPGTIQDSSEASKEIFVVRESDIPFGKSWQDWKDAVNFGAKFYDGDFDGVYSPVDKNYNGIWDSNEDMPYLLGDITAWCIYNDSRTPRRIDDTYPVGIEVSQTVFASNKNGLQNTIFIIYSLRNTGYLSDSLTNVYFSIYTDPDIGDYGDDLSGCDTTIRSSYTYNEGEDIELGEDPPAIFFTLLQGPKVIDTTLGGFGSEAINNFGFNYGIYSYEGYRNLGPSSFQNYFRFENPFFVESKYSTYNRMQGQKPEGGFINPCTFNEGIVVPDSICNIINPLFMYSGDPLINYGWLDTAFTDQRNRLSCGPFNLLLNEPQHLIVAYTAAKDSNSLASITAGKEFVEGIIQEYENNFINLTYHSGAPINPILDYKLEQNFPNPFNPKTTIRYELPQDGLVSIEVFDILGQKIRTLLNEFKKADRYELEFNGDNLSSGVYLYSIRVNDFIETKKMILLK